MKASLRLFLDLYLLMFPYIFRFISFSFLLSLKGTVPWDMPRMDFEFFRIFVEIIDTLGASPGFNDTDNVIISISIELVRTFGNWFILLVLLLFLVKRYWQSAKIYTTVSPGRTTLVLHVLPKSVTVVLRAIPVSWTLANLVLFWVITVPSGRTSPLSLTPVMDVSPVLLTPSCVIPEVPELFNK